MESQLHFPKTSGIYCFQNIINGHRYIGSAVNLHRRQWEHLKDLRKDTHYNPHMQRSFLLHGESSFVWMILEDVVDPTNLLEREQHYIDTLKPEYNIAAKAGSLLGFKRSPEWIEMTRIRNTGKTHTPEVRARLSAAHKGKKQSPELVEKRALGMKGHQVSGEARAKIAAARKGKPGNNLGKKFSHEHRAKMSEAQRGRKQSEETKAKLSALNKGKKHPNPSSPEHLERLQKLNTGTKRSEETKMKLREAWKHRKARQQKEANDAC